jgi:hypothetical protein
MTNDNYDWDKKTVEDITRNVLDGSTSTTQKEGETEGYEPAQYEPAKLTPQQDRTNYYAQIFGSVNPPPEANKDEEDRLRRTAQIQALGDLFKHLGNFAGAGHAPVEKRQENIRLYQTLDKIDANRARVEALANQYKQNRQAYINMMTKADRDAYLQEQKIKQDVMDKNVEATNNARRFAAENHNKSLPTVTTRNNKYKEVNDRRVTSQEVNPNGYTANKGGKDGNSTVTFYNQPDDKKYAMSRSAANGMFSTLAENNYVKAIEGGYLAKILGDARWSSNEKEWQAAMNEFMRAAKTDPKFKKIWDDLMENNRDVRRYYISSGMEIQPQQSAEPIPNADGTVSLSEDDIKEGKGLINPDMYILE